MWDPACKKGFYWNTLQKITNTKTMHNPELADYIRNNFDGVRGGEAQGILCGGLCTYQQLIRYALTNKLIIDSKQNHTLLEFYMFLNHILDIEIPRYNIFSENYKLEKAIKMQKEYVSNKIDKEHFKSSLYKEYKREMLYKNVSEILNTFYTCGTTIINNLYNNNIKYDFDVILKTITYINDNLTKLFNNYGYQVFVIKYITNYGSEFINLRSSCVEYAHFTFSSLNK
jgi:hypothetical protein